MIATFLLTYIKDAKNGNETSHPETWDLSQFEAMEQELVGLRSIGGDCTKQTLMFLTGPGGSGKSEVIKAVLGYASAYCNNLGVPFTRRTITVTALTGVAATSINGETVHSAAYLNSSRITDDMIREWKHVRLLIVDEVSFAKKSELQKLSDNLRILRETQLSLYGGLPIIFAGDFSQLPPVKAQPLYRYPNFTLWWDEINCFWQLNGSHRFERIWGEILRRFREGRPRPEDFVTINKRVVANADMIPNDAAYATSTNKDRCAINNGLFARHLEATHSRDSSVPPPQHTIVIRGSNLQWNSRDKSAKRMLNQQARCDLWEKCADCDVECGSSKNGKGHFVDPLLKFFSGIPLMLVENVDVPNNQANGTLCHLVKIHFREGISNDNIDLMRIDGYWVRCVDACDVESIEAVFADGDRKGEHFHICPKKMSCRVNFPFDCFGLGMGNHRLHVSISITQFPVLVNQATTCHKLQSKSKDNLVVSGWSYARNWPYVVLSRIRSLTGLFLREPLDPTKDYSMDPGLVAMLDYFKRTKSPQPVP
jgi:hypothetical protein